MLKNRHNLTGWMAALSLVAGVLAGVDRARANPDGGGAAEGAAAGAGALPSDVDMVLVVENAAELRRSPVGGAVATFLGDAGVLAQTDAAWGTLARQLGWSRDEAFDRLIGGRVVLLFRAGAAAGQGRWALLSDVSAETDARLKGKLEVAPRKIDKGHPILLVENGQFELTTHRSRKQQGRGAAPAAQHNARPVTLVLGPAGRSELFDEMVGVLDRGAAQPLGGTDVFKSAAGAGPAEVLLIVRPGPTGRALAAAANQAAGNAARVQAAAPGPDRRAWEDFLVIAGRRAGADGRAWTSRVILRDRHRREALRDVAVTSDAPFRALEQGALLAVVQSGSLEAVFGKEFALGDLLGMMPMPEAAKPLLAGRQAFALHRVPAGGEDGAGGGVACALAVESKDAPGMAKSMDGAIARFVQTLEQRFGAVRPPPRDFAGAAPQVARVLPVELSEDGPQQMLTKDPIVLSWAYPSAAAPGGAPSPGWWVLAVAAVGAEGAWSPADAVRANSAALLARAEQGEMGRWVWLGRARPAEMEAMLPEAVPDLRGFRSVMRRVEDIGVRLSITETGEIQGDLSLRLAEAAPAAAPAAR